MRHIVTFDSSERDMTVWKSPQDFELTFNTPIYNVSEIAVVSVHIPLTQPTIVKGNSIIPLGGGTLVTLNVLRFFTDPVTLAAHAQAVIQTQLPGVTVTYDTTYRIFVFQRTSAFEFNWASAEYPDECGPAANLLGFAGRDVQAVEVTPGAWELQSGVVSTINPVRSLLLRLTHGEDDLTEPVFTSSDTAMFFGRILVDPSQATVAMRNGEVMVRKLKVNVPTLDAMRLRLYWNNGGRLFQYDLREANCLIKFAFECDHTRMGDPEKPVDLPEEKELPEPVEYPTLSFDDRQTDRQFIIYAVMGVLVLGLLFIAPRRTPAAAA